ncbi:MAG TPA: peroxiredoxin [Candidatus Caldiarchaeum subterraneum]|uniref:thioredoxin-dependent peroxiredoxin n=1 Tax=Caldiarchaeum subterraneum TaxID=311458 RepID=A0A833A5F8_CALS0|nr:peroxiredoxin [Candidatus Caldarchaeum subterraneum]
MQLGDLAPDFTLPAYDGTTITLSSFKGKKRVVLFFYPKDESPGCTRENCMIRDSLDEFTKRNAVVFGISRDNLEKHRRFAERHGFAHTLLSDVKGEVCRTYGALTLFGFMVKRRTVVIDEEGVIRGIVDSPLPSRHVKEALKILDRL